MELHNTPRDQVINLTKFVYGLSRATAVNPAPCIPNWVGGNAANIRAAHRALTLDVVGLEADQLEVGLANLVVYCRHFVRLPNLTRIILSELDLWLTHADRAAKSALITAAYPNEEGAAGAVDTFVSVWRDIQTTLTQVGSCCKDYSDKGTSTVAVIVSDFDALVKELTLKRHTMDSGSRKAGIHECRELTKRINIAQESEYKLDESARQTMMDWHSSLLQDKAEADRLRQLLKLTRWKLQS